jgi:Flp pilus assembly protein TadG
MIRAGFRSIRRDQRGAAIIELALAAPFMAAIVIGMSDLARAYSMKLQLEQASQRTIEQVENQQSRSSASYNTALTTEAGNAMSDAGYSTGNTITPDSWLECSSNGGTSWTRQTNFTDSCPNASDVTARYVKVTISRNFVPMFASFAWPGANSSGQIPLTGYAEVRIQ